MVFEKKAGFLATAAFFLPLTLGAQSYSPAQQQAAETKTIVLDYSNYSRDELFGRKVEDEGNLEKKAEAIFNIEADKDENFKIKKTDKKEKKPFYKSWEFWAWQAGMNVNSARAIESKYKRAFRECSRCRHEVKIPNFPVGRWERYVLNFSIDTLLNIGSHWSRNRKNRFLKIMGRVLPSTRIAQTGTEAYINNRISDGFDENTARQRALYGQQNQ